MTKIEDIITNEYFFIVIGIIATTIFGIIPYAIGIYNFTKSQKSLNWKPSTGNITSLEWKTYETIERQDNGYERVLISYKTLINYEYQWLNQKYSSNRIRFGYTSTSDSEFHKNLYSTLENVQKIKIWVNPKQPEQATIIKGYSGSKTGILPAIIFGYVVLWISLTMLGSEYPNYSKMIKTVIIGLTIITIIMVGYIFKNTQNHNITDGIEIISNTNHLNKKYN